MYERTDLIEAELDSLYLISQVLNSTHDLHTKIQAVLEVLHKSSGMRSGMISLKEIESDSLIVSAVHANADSPLKQPVRYNPHNHHQVQCKGKLDIRLALLSKIEEVLILETLGQRK